MSTDTRTPKPETRNPLLDIRDLRTYFFTEAGVVKAVDGVTFTIAPGEVMGLVGESGCGKSVTALSVLRLIQSPPGKVVGGRILFRERDLLTFGQDAMRAIRGNQISMIFQEPMTSLNPVFTIGYQIGETIILHQKVGRAEARRRAVELLGKVGIPEPALRVRQYPHELSGGMRQRVMIAMALSCNPALLIADEPTTALDVTIQAQILELLNALRQELGMSVLLITHDLGVIAETAHRVAVMYAGKVAEYAPVETLFAQPLHPYTQGLFRSLPRLVGRREKLAVIPGAVPDALQLPTGCTFHPRCPRAFGPCPIHAPPLEDVAQPPSAAAIDAHPGAGVPQAHTCACWAVFKELGRPVP